MNTRNNGPTCLPFAFGDYLVTEPSLSTCGRFTVDPIEYYGDAYLQAQSRWDQYCCDYGCSANAVCTTCGEPMCDHSHEIYSTQCLQCDNREA